MTTTNEWSNIVERNTHARTAPQMFAAGLAWRAAYVFEQLQTQEERQIFMRQMFPNARQPSIDAALRQLEAVYRQAQAFTHSDGVTPVGQIHQVAPGSIPGPVTYTVVVHIVGRMYEGGQVVDEIQDRRYMQVYADSPTTYDDVFNVATAEIADQIGTEMSPYNENMMYTWSINDVEVIAITRRSY